MQTLPAPHIHFVRCIISSGLQNHVNGMLKDRWDALSDDGKQIWKEWEIWDAKRYEYQLGIYQKKNSNQGSPKKAKSVEEIPKTTSNNTAVDHTTSKSATGAFSIPKRRSA